MTHAKAAQLNVIFVQAGVLAVLKWRNVQSYAWIVRRYAIYARLSVQEAPGLPASLRQFVQQFVKPVLSNAESMIMNNVNAVLMHAEDVLTPAEV